MYISLIQKNAARYIFDRDNVIYRREFTQQSLIHGKDEQYVYFDLSADVLNVPPPDQCYLFTVEKADGLGAGYSLRGDMVEDYYLRGYFALNNSTVYNCVGKNYSIAWYPDYKTDNLVRQHIKLKLYGTDYYKILTLPDSLKTKMPNRISKICTDSNGFINSTHVRYQARKIFFLGDSFIECSFIEQGKRLCDNVNELLFNDHLPYQVVNCGMSGSSLLHQYNLYINFLKQYPESKLMIFSGNISRKLNYIPETFWSHSYLSNLTGYAKNDITINGVDNKYVHYQQILELCNHACEIFQTSLLVCASPFCHSATNGAFQSSFRDMNNSLKEFAQRKTLPFLNLDEEVSDNSHYFYDDIHLNEIGASVYAHVIFNFLAQFFA